MGGLGVIEITMSDFFCTRYNEKIQKSPNLPKNTKKSYWLCIFAINWLLRNLIILTYPSGSLHILAKAFLKEYSVSIHIRFHKIFLQFLSFIGINVILSMSHKKLMDKNKNAPLKKISPYCGHRTKRTCDAYIFFSSHFVSFFPAIKW